jgi:hypothetical protein
MARSKTSSPNIDNSNLLDYPAGRIKDSTGAGDGTPVNEFIYGDKHETFDKLMRLAGINFNGLPDNETNGYQYLDALRSLASKNDFITTLNSVGGFLSIGLKLNLLLVNEQIVCKASVDLTTETQIKGSDGSTIALTFVGNFKANEYVRLIKTGAGITLVRLVDLTNLDLAVSEAQYLKKANQTQENAGTLDTVASTPLTNLTAFIKRVTGTDSILYLATSIRNGLYPKEHFNIVANIGASPVRNIGTASGIDIGYGAIGTNYPISGNIVSAILVDKPTNASTIRVVLSNTMTDSNYYVRMFVESNASIIGLDNGVGVPVFKIINPTTFDFSIQSFQATAQNLKIHFEVVKK